MNKSSDNLKYYIGLMSGTSLDGIDVSIISTDGKKFISVVDNLFVPYPENIRNKILRSRDDYLKWLEIEQKLSELNAKAVLMLLQQSQILPSEIEAIGFHGQTLYHDSRKKLSWQIGNPHILKSLTGINVVSDFRRADIANGGQGAPLIPIFHQALAHKLSMPVLFVNIGGVANITYIDEHNLIAFDTGPGCALINDAVEKYFSQAFDKDGKIARSGSPNIHFINNILSNSYFTEPYPKSLDRDHFKKLVNIEVNKCDINPTDLISSLTMITAKSIALSLKLLPNSPKQIILCGGGSHNKFLIEQIHTLTNTRAENISDILSLNPDFIEAQGFAYLAARCKLQLPSSFSSTTGVNKPTICGVII